MLSVAAQSLLRRVRARMETDWCRGSYHRGNKYCLVGLLRDEAWGNASSPHVDRLYVESGYTEARHRIMDLVGGHGIENWNDAHTKEDVIQLLDDAMAPDMSGV